MAQSSTGPTKIDLKTATKEELIEFVKKQNTLLKTTQDLVKKLKLDLQESDKSKKELDTIKPTLVEFEQLKMQADLAAQVRSLQA